MPYRRKSDGGLHAPRRQEDHQRNGAPAVTATTSPMKKDGDVISRRQEWHSRDHLRRWEDLEENQKPAATDPTLASRPSRAITLSITSSRCSGVKGLWRMGTSVPSCWPRKPRVGLSAVIMTTREARCGHSRSMRRNSCHPAVPV